jgi:cell division protein FtsB
MNHKHDLSEREVICYTDGLCPLCLREENARLSQRVKELERAVALLDQAATDYRKGRDAAEAKLAARGE